MLEHDLWHTLGPAQQAHVLALTFGDDFRVAEAKRILDEPTMAELALYGPRFVAAVEEVSLILPTRCAPGS